MQKIIKNTRVQFSSQKYDFPSISTIYQNNNNNNNNNN